MRFYGRVEFKPLGIPRMHIGEMQIEKLIRLVERLELHDGAVNTLR